MAVDIDFHRVLNPMMCVGYAQPLLEKIFTIYTWIWKCHYTLGWRWQIGLRVYWTLYLIKIQFVDMQQTRFLLFRFFFFFVCVLVFTVYPNVSHSITDAFFIIMHDHRCRVMSHKPHGNLTHWGRDNMAAIFHTTFSNAFPWMKIYEFRLIFFEFCSQGSN